MRILSTLTIAALAMILAGTAPAAASNAIAKAEGDMVCTSCHDKPGSKLLTDQGKYYDLMSTLEGFTEINAAYGKCTSCHVRKPGSLRLTKTGKRFQWMITDMDGLRDLVLGEHPSGELPEPPEMEEGESPAEGDPSSKP